MYKNQQKHNLDKVHLYGAYALLLYRHIYSIYTYIWVKSRGHWTIARLSCRTLHFTLAYLVEVSLKCSLEETTMTLAPIIYIYIYLELQIPGYTKLECNSYEETNNLCGLLHCYHSCNINSCMLDYEVASLWR